MSDKPKLWNGPSPVGEGAARGNEISGAPYQTHVAPGVISRKMGMFSEVVKDEPPPPESGEPTIFAGGRVNDSDVIKYRESEAYNLPFKSSRTIILDPVGFNYAKLWIPDISSIRGEFVYRHPQAPADDVIVGGGYEEGSIDIRLVYKKSVVAVATYPVATRTFITPTYDNTKFIYQRWDALNLGRLNKDSEPRMLVTVPFTTATKDSYDFNTTQWMFTIVSLNKKELPEQTEFYGFPLPGGGGDSDYDVVSLATITPTEFVVVLVEYPAARKGQPGDYEDVRFERTWYSPGALHNHGVISYEDMEPRVWLYKTTDSGMSWSRRRMTIFEEHVSAQVTEYGEVISPTQPLFGYPSYLVTYKLTTGSDDTPFLLSYPKTLGSYTDCLARANDLLGAFEIVIMSRRKWLILFNILDARIYSVGVIQARSFILRTEDAGVSWVSVESPFTSTIGAAEPHSTDYTFSGTVLRDGVVVVRCAAGRKGFDRDVKFLRSTDYGATWEEFTPTGLPEIRSDKIGYLKVLKVYTEGGVMKTLTALPAWKATEDGGEYRIYLSTDDGTTWVKGRKLASSTRLWRMDHDEIANETNRFSDNFGTLDVRGPERKPESLDIALPWRYDGAITPPST